MLTIPKLCSKIKSSAQRGDHSVSDAEKYYKQCGLDLIELKRRCKYGDFKATVKDKCKLSYASAWRYMVIAKGKLSLADLQARNRVSNRAHYKHTEKQPDVLKQPGRINVPVEPEREPVPQRAAHKHVKPFSSANGRTLLVNLDAWLCSAIQSKLEERFNEVLNEARKSKSLNHEERHVLADTINRLRAYMSRFIEELDKIDIGPDPDAHIKRSNVILIKSRA